MMYQIPEGPQIHVYFGDEFISPKGLGPCLGGEIGVVIVLNIGIQNMLSPR